MLRKRDFANIPFCFLSLFPIRLYCEVWFWGEFSRRRMRECPGVGQPQSSQRYNESRSVKGSRNSDPVTFRSRLTKRGEIIKSSITNTRSDFERDFPEREIHSTRISRNLISALAFVIKFLPYRDPLVLLEASWVRNPDSIVAEQRSENYPKQFQFKDGRKKISSTPFSKAISTRRDFSALENRLSVNHNPIREACTPFSRLIRHSMESAAKINFHKLFSSILSIETFTPTVDGWLSKARGKLLHRLIILRDHYTRPNGDAA